MVNLIIKKNLKNGKLLNWQPEIKNVYKIINNVYYFILLVINITLKLIF